MLKGLRYRIQLARMRRAQSATDESYKKDLEKARREGKSRDEIETIKQEQMMEYFSSEEEINKHHSCFLCSTATDLFLPVPKDGWETKHYTGGNSLTQVAASQLYESIRKERQARRQDWQGSLFWFTGLTGVIGALTGLIAIITGLITLWHGAAPLAPQ